jgi:hypothetical protein
MLEVGLRQYLLDSLPPKYARVSGLVREQQSQLPEVLLTRTSTTPELGLCGTFDFRSCEMQIDTYAMTGEDAWSLAKSLRALLTDFSGSMGDTEIRRVLLVNEFPLTDPEPGVIRVVQLYTFWYLED